jgi:hypothetical protein
MSDPQHKPPRLLTEIALLFYMVIIFVLHWKHMPPLPLLWDSFIIFTVTIRTDCGVCWIPDFVQTWSGSVPTVS